MERQVALIGFGEAAQAFVRAPGWQGSAHAYDKLTDDPNRRASKLADYAAASVRGANTLEQALDTPGVILSLVTTGEALNAAQDAAKHIAAGSIYFDMNSVSPATKRSAAKVIEAAGGYYVDAAVMSPVHSARLAAPVLLSGPHGSKGERVLREIGFESLRCVGSQVGDASAIKMVRSVLVKGIEALTAEAMMAAFAAGVAEEVLNSLDASELNMSWSDRANYNLDRMMLHGSRRADEMDEVVRTLESLGVEAALTRETARKQRELGALGIYPQASLHGKMGQVLPTKANAA